MASRSHKVENHPVNGAVVGILIEHEDNFHCCRALLDGGATRSLLPYSAVAKLGLKKKLRRTRGIRIAGGRRLKAWRSEVTLSAQLATLENEVATRLGPQVALEPWFVKPQRRFRGRARSRGHSLAGPISSRHFGTRRPRRSWCSNGTSELSAAFGVAVVGSGDEDADQAAEDDPEDR